MTGDIRRRLTQIEAWSPRSRPDGYVEGEELLLTLLAVRGFDPDAVPPGGLFNAVVKELDEMMAELRDGRVPSETAAIFDQWRERQARRGHEPRV